VQELCDVIAALPFGITASVGSAGIHPAHRAGDDDDGLLFELTSAADDAMYTAKRRGGSQAGHHVWPPPLSSLAEDETDYRDGVSA
jgi:GGDEF domain-containing protein